MQFLFKFNTVGVKNFSDLTIIKSCKRKTAQIVIELTIKCEQHICCTLVTIQRIIFLSRLRREIFQIYTNHTILFWRILKDFVRFEKICEISVTKWHSMKLSADIGCWHLLIISTINNQAPQKCYNVTKLQSYKNTNRGMGEWAEKMRDEFLIIYIMYIIYIINYYNIINKLPN